MGMGGQRHALGTLPPRRSPGTHCTGGWVGPRAGVDGSLEKEYLKRDDGDVFSF
jgi:hypothetical protein